LDITFLGAHSCETKTSRMTSILIDDVLAIDAGGLTSSLSFEEQKQLEVVLLTHHHYDHVRDLPVLARNLLLQQSNVILCSTQTVRDALASHLLDGDLYRDFLAWPPEKPTFTFSIINPYETITIAGYTVTALPSNHSVPAVGYYIVSPEGKNLFYTADTGPTLAGYWEKVSPDLLITEITAPDRYIDFCEKLGHLNPGLLQVELDNFRKIKGYLPKVVTVHINPMHEEEIGAQVAALNKAGGYNITIAHEGMKIHL